ncbi:MAG: DNA repair protein RadC [Candidatus Diapherotrites archaeon]
MRMMDIPFSSRPRERAKVEGIASLSDAELVAILLRSGRKGKNALELGMDSLSLVDGSLDELYRRSHPSYNVLNLGAVQQLTLHAGLELGKRMMRKDQHSQSLDDALSWIRDKVAVEQRELFYVILLDLRDRCVASPILLSRGNRYQVVVDPKDVLHAVVSRNAARVVIVHNHPSHDVQPSPQDILLTKQILEGCGWVDVELVDHIILSRGESFSFRKNGMLE